MNKRSLLIALALFMALLSTFNAFSQSNPLPISCIILNTLPGFGVGSFLQGDATAGLILLGGDVVGLGLATAGLVLSLEGLKINFFNPTPPSGPNPYAPLLYAAVIIYSASKVMGIVFPIIYKPTNIETKVSKNQLKTQELPIRVEPSIELDENSRPILKCCVNVQI